MSTLYIHGDLEPGHVLQVYEARDELDELVIDSTGGDIQLALSVIQCMRRGVRTTALSRCMSASVYIFAAGSERVCLPSTMFLTHAGTTSVDCDSATFEEFKRFHSKVERRLSSLLPESMAGMDSGNDVVFDGLAAKRYGLATRILR